MRKLVNWQQINRRRAKKHFKEYGTFVGYPKAKNFEETVGE